MLTQMNKIYVEKSKDLGNDQWKINFMNEQFVLLWSPCYHINVFSYCYMILYMLIMLQSGKLK